MHVLYTDESWIQLQATNSQNLRFRTNSPSTVPVFQLPKHPIKIMVVGGICGFGKTELHIVDNKTTIDGNYYRDVILPIYFDTMEKLMPDQELAILRQDGAPSHSANDTIELIEKKLGDNYWGKGIWPGGSPDLNPIEHCWSILQDTVFIEPRPLNRESLIERVVKTWKNLDLNYCNKLVNSLPNRIQELEEKKVVKRLIKLRENIN